MPTILQRDPSHGLRARVHRVTRWYGLAALVLMMTATSAPAQDALNPPKPNAPPAGSPAAEPGQADHDGFWPAPSVLHVIIAHAAETSCNKRSVTREQCAKFGTYIADNWSDLIEENRDALQPLLDDYLDMRLGSQPPTPERVRSWAEKAEPVVDRLLAERRAMRAQAAQQPESAAGTAETDAIETGLEVARERIARWKRGEYKTGTFWGPAAGVRDALLARPDSAAAAREESGTDAPAALPDDPIAVELLGWARYVEEFAARYRLDAAQRDAAMSCLLEMTQRANAHRERHLEDVAGLERRINEASRTPAAKDELKREIVRLYGPIDDMFAELKQRLEQIPTTEQRRRVEQDDQKKKKASG